MFFFFFSSRRRHTRLQGDWSSDVCSSDLNALTTLMLGGLTQTQMEARAHPTFVTVWIGNNDVLGAATNSTNGGDSTKITPVTAFQARYTAMLDSVAAVGL